MTIDKSKDEMVRLYKRLLKVIVDKDLKQYVEFSVMSLDFNQINKKGKDNGKK